MAQQDAERIELELRLQQREVKVRIVKSNVVGRGGEEEEG
jgi:hypothetical protein